MQAARLIPYATTCHTVQARFDAGWVCFAPRTGRAVFVKGRTWRVTVRVVGVSLHGVPLRVPDGRMWVAENFGFIRPRLTRPPKPARRRRRRLRVYAVDGSGRRVKTQVLVTTLRITDMHGAYDAPPVDVLGRLVAASTDEVLPYDWEGWATGADWAYRTHDLRATRRVMDDLRAAPAFGRKGLPRGPRSKALRAQLQGVFRTLDFFTRLKAPDGGVRGGVMQDTDPRFLRGVLQKAQTFYAYAPDVWTTWEYAATAAKMSRILAPRDKAAAALWVDRARHAMAWAEARVPQSIDAPHQTARNLAAAELFAATCGVGWHRLFQQTSSYGVGCRPAWNGFQYEAAATYCDLDAALTDPAIATAARAALVRQGNFRAQTGAGGMFAAQLSGCTVSVAFPDTVAGCARRRSAGPLRVGGRLPLLLAPFALSGKKAPLPLRCLDAAGVVHVSPVQAAASEIGLVHATRTVDFPPHLQWVTIGPNLSGTGPWGADPQRGRGWSFAPRTSRPNSPALPDPRTARLLLSGFAEAFTGDPAKDSFV